MKSVIVVEPVFFTKNDKLFVLQLMTDAAGFSMLNRAISFSAIWDGIGDCQTPLP
mgnify:CR=1 FL=1